MASNIGIRVSNIFKATHVTPTSTLYDSAHNHPNDAVDSILASSMLTENGVFNDRGKEKGDGYL